MINEQAAAHSLKESARILFSGIIDYAGLFPPTQVSMPEAVMNYVTYKHSNYSWMLGRFITPVVRLDELLENSADLISRDAGWRVSVLASENINDTVKRINLFNSQNAPRIIVDTLEVRATTVSKIENTADILPEGITAFVETAMNENFPDMVAALAIKGLRAKIRTGGVTNESFPSSHKVIRFVRTCTAANVPFKATAGLHHPLAAGGAHGFLNVLAAVVFEDEAALEGDVELDEEALRWNGRDAGAEQLELVRRERFLALGSCSFFEPVAELQELGVL